jgi:hypothetical protein
MKVSGKRRQRRSELDQVEVQARVCSLFLAGKSVKQIVEICREEGIPLTRHDPYKILAEANGHKRFKYIAPPAYTMADDLVDRFPRLRARLDVVHSVEISQIAARAAEKILEMITGSYGENRNKNEFHIGFAGGGLLELTAGILSDKLRECRLPLPEMLYFHSLVARFDDDPVMDPNSFVRHFIMGSPLPLAIRFVGIMAPGFIETDTVRQLRQTEGIREAFEKIGALDLLVTSAGGHWKSCCSRLHQLYEFGKHHQLLNELNAQFCVGDLMWCPVGASGPIVLDHGKRAMTLVDLTDLPGLIGKGKRVMLILGPCASCHQPKSEILRTLLKMRQPLITDLVVDSYTARTVLAELAVAAIHA